MGINLWLKREPNLQGRKRGEGYREYPSPGFGLGHSQSQQQHSIVTTDFGFNQANRSVGERFSLAPSRAMSEMRALQTMGARFCIGLLRWLLETPLVEAIPLSCLSAHPSA
jgi:hypothetical protein